jgi:hypothetical protein
MQSDVRKNAEPILVGGRRGGRTIATRSGNCPNNDRTCNHSNDGASAHTQTQASTLTLGGDERISIGLCFFSKNRSSDGNGQSGSGLFISFSYPLWTITSQKDLGFLMP